MKKITAAVLAFILVFALCGCSALDEQKAPEETAAPAETVVPIEAEPEPTPAPERDYNPVIIRNIEESSSYKDPKSGEKEIFFVKCSSPYIVIESNEAAAEKINDSIKAIDETFYTGEDYGFGSDFGADINYYQSLAEDNFMLSDSGVESAVLPFTIIRSYSVLRADEKLIGINFINSIDADGHTEKSYSFYFSTETGETVSTEEIGKSEYKPERTGGNTMGGFGVKKLSELEASGENIPIIDLLVIDEGGSDYVIFNTDGNTYDVKIERVLPEGASEYNILQSFWYCSELYNSGVQIRAANYTDGSCLRIGWTTAEGVLVENLLQFGDDGVPELKNASNPDALG